MTALRSLPELGVGLELGDRAGRGSAIVNETVPVVAKSSGPTALPSGLVPNFSDAAASAGSTARRGTRRQDRAGRAPPPGDRRAAASVGSAPRPAGAAPGDDARDCAR